MRLVPSSPSLRAGALAAVVAVASSSLGVVGCAGVAPPVASPAARTASSEASPEASAETAASLSERTLLLMLSDRRLYESVVVQTSLTKGPGLRRILARSLGQMGDAKGLEPLAGLLLDDDVEVRRAAAFALGELGESLEAMEGRAAREDEDEGSEGEGGTGPVDRIGELLLRAVADEDRETGSLAVEALAKIGAPVLEVADSLTPLNDQERWARILPHLFRFRDEEVLPLAEAGLRVEDPYLHARAAYALARDPLPEAAPLLRTLLGDPDPWLRGWAARALGEVGRGEDLALMGSLLEGDEDGPVIQALRAGKRLIEEGKASPPPAWRGPLIELLASTRPQVRITAIDAAGSWLQDEVIGPILIALAGSEGGADHRPALLALARGDHPRASELAETAARSASAASRSAGTEAAGLLGENDLLAELADDQSPRVRLAALDGRLRSVAAPLELLSEALTDGDPGISAFVFDRLNADPVVSMEVLVPAVAAALRDGNVESSLSGVRAIAARAEAEPLERGSLVAVLEDLAVSGDFLVRRQAARSLGALGRPVPAVGSVDSERRIEAYDVALQRTLRPRIVDLHTDRGAIRLRLDCPRAPLTCLNFLNLAAQGFYDGLAFHRVVPDFVIQGGDPRGDGWGGPRYTIRDEINDLRYGRGVVGMALAGADTGGSQFFITLSPQPHLDGGYTAFGEVIDGFEVLDSILPGDRIERIEESP